MPRTVPRWSRRLLPRHPEVILSATIEYAHTQGQRGMRLGAGNDELSAQSLEKEVCRVLEDRLPADLEKLFGLDARIEMRGFRSGSLVAFFSVLLTGYTLLASYKSFFDSVQLIREHAAFLLRKLVRDREPQHTFKVQVEPRYPSLPHPHDLYAPSRLGTRRGHPKELPWAAAELHPPAAPGRRDGFFWFLLALSTLLLAALGTLVYAAVVQTYFS